MVVSVIANSDTSCGAVRIASDLFVDFFESSEGTLTLSYTINCGTPIEVNFTHEDIPITYYDITTSTDKVCDGIYCAKLSYKALDNNPTVLVEYGSTYVNCDILCKIAEEFNEDRSSSSSILYNEAIKLSVTCSTCSCTEACVIWNELNSIVNGLENQVDIKKFVKTEDCGCNKSK